MVLIEQSVETPRSPNIATRSLDGRPRGGLVGVPISKRPQINNVQYPRIPSRILKHTSHEEVINDVVAEDVMYEIVNDEALEKC
jgi:hypothetical protein